MSFKGTGLLALEQYFSASQATAHKLGHGIGMAYAELEVGLSPIGVGSHNLGLTLPAGAILLFAFVDVETVPTSGGAATLAIQVGSTDIVAAAAISGVPWSTTGLKAGVQDNTVANAHKSSSDEDVKAVVAVDSLTAGKVKVYLHYHYPSP